MSDTSLIQKLVRNFLLGDDTDGVLSAHSNRRDSSRLHGFESILDLEEASFGREDRDVAIIARSASSAHFGIFDLSLIVCS